MAIISKNRGLVIKRQNFGCKNSSTCLLQSEGGDTPLTHPVGNGLRWLGYGGAKLIPVLVKHLLVAGYSIHLTLLDNLGLLSWLNVLRVVV